MFSIKLHEIKLIIQLALPLTAAFLAQKGMQLIDTVMMGWLGPYALAAGAFGTAIFMTTVLFCMGTLSAIGVYIVRARGANQTDQIKFNLQQGLFMVLYLSLPCMLIVWLAPYVLPLLHQDPQVIKNTELLLHGLIWGLPGSLLFLLFREFVAAFMLTRVVMIITLCSIPLTFIVNYVLIYGKYGFPALGIAGIGYGGAAIMWVMFLSLLFYAKQHPILKEHVFAWHELKYSRTQVSRLFKTGLPSGTSALLDVGTVLAAALMMGHFGVDALAAHQIALQCASLAYTIPFSLSMATALQVGHAAASNDFVQVKRYTALGVAMGLFSAIIVAILFITIPEQISKLFLKNSTADYSQLIHLATSFLAIAAIFQCLDAIQAIMSGALRGLKDTFVPMLMILVSYWLGGICSSYYFAFHTKLGVLGVWCGLSFGFSVAGILLLFRFLQQLKKEQRVSQAILEPVCRVGKTAHASQ